MHFAVWYGNCPVDYNMLGESVKMSCKDVGIEIHKPKPACDNSDPWLGIAKRNSRYICNGA